LRVHYSGGSPDNLLSIIEVGTGAMQARFTYDAEGQRDLVLQWSQQGSRLYGFGKSANTWLLTAPSPSLYPYVQERALSLPPLRAECFGTGRARAGARLTC
jgi:hypothetical protein